MQSFWYVLPGSLFWPDVSPFSFCITRPATDFPKERTTCDTAARKIHMKILLKILGIHAYISRFNREEPETEKWFQTLFFVTSLAIPLLCILCFYLNMLVRLWKGSAATHGPGPMRDKNNACKGKENKVRVTRMVIIVIIVFAICWVPLQVILLIFGSTPLDTWI